MVLSKEESLEKVYFDFLSIVIIFSFLDKKNKYQPIAGRHMSSGPAVVQGFTKKESLFRNFMD